MYREIQLQALSIIGVAMRSRAVIEKYDDETGHTMSALGHELTWMMFALNVRFTSISGS